MSTSEAGVPNQERQQHIAAEVLELGKSLFEIALEARNHQSAEEQRGETYPLEEIRATSDEFFTALRLLLRIEE